ncbi:MAG: hypothetical protein KKG59_02680, partial [Nanoarchaeota archaeon]|nr:hypothetical protein [Nanoarchaeota archaeon]
MKCICYLLVLLLSLSMSSADWQAYHHDFGRSGVATGKGPFQNDEIWSVNVDDPPTQIFHVGDEIIVRMDGSSSGNDWIQRFKAVDGDSNHQKYHFNTGLPSENNKILFGDGDSIYVTRAGSPQTVIRVRYTNFNFLE